MPHWTQKVSASLLRSEYTDNPEQKCRLIVEMATPQVERLEPYVAANDGKVHRKMRQFPLVIMEIPYSSIQLMAMSPHVRKVWHDTKVKTLLDIAVPAVEGSKIHEQGFTGKDVTVAVIDTGISPHPDLVYPESRIIAWHDLVNDRPIPYDDNGHGTHVSGIIAGNGVSSRGKYVGMAPEAKLIGIKALDREGSGNTSDVISAIEWCIENQKIYNIRAINLSLGATAESSSREDPLCRAVTAAWNSGIVVCVAAGNDGPALQTINTPGITPSAITVGNLDTHRSIDFSDDSIAESSSRGPTIDNLNKPDILAPGTNITSLWPGKGYRSLSGTSMATPMVTGAVAQILQKYPSYRPEQVKSVLTRNARTMGFQSMTGALKIDQIFEESKKNNNEQKTIFSTLFNSLSSLFQKRPVSKTNEEKSEKEKPKLKGLFESFNPMALALLLPLALI